MIRKLSVLALTAALSLWTIGCQPDASPTEEPTSPPDEQREPASPPEEKPEPASPPA